MMESMSKFNLVPAGTAGGKCLAYWVSKPMIMHTQESKTVDSTKKCLNRAQEIDLTSPKNV